MKKQVLIAFAVGLCITANTFAQIPGYVPTNGLVGYWPFNGNANDESGSGNNGTVNGATLTTDRFGVANKAYSFINGNNIETSYFPTNVTQVTYSAWFKTLSGGCLIGSNSSNNVSNLTLTIHTNSTSTGNQGTALWVVDRANSSVGWMSQPPTNPLYNDNIWHHMVGVFNCSSGNVIQPSNLILYVDGQIISTISQNVNPSVSPINIFSNIVFGYNQRWISQGFDGRFIGSLDDIGIWNRALSDCEIADLYNSQINSVAGSILTSPQSAAVGSTVTLSSSTTSQSVQWQNNPLNNGWQNVPTNTTYSGGNTNTLTVNNVQLSNHNQPFRLIANAGNCSDTSNVATIQIADTCITNVTIYDTLLTTVTDTLIINTTLSLPAPNNENTILIYPNPASDHITIDNGNFAAMAGYNIKIENNVGQQVFQSAINQAQFYVDLSTWTGNGLYFVHLIDPQNNTVTVRKIVLQ
jgi:hypothetical protein